MLQAKYRVATDIANNQFSATDTAIPKKNCIFAYVIFMITQTTMKKIATFAFQVIVTTIIFTVLSYLLNLISDGIKEFDWNLLVQGFIFAILYIPLSSWWMVKRSK